VFTCNIFALQLDTKILLNKQGHFNNVERVKDSLLQKIDLEIDFAFVPQFVFQKLADCIKFTRQGRFSSGASVENFRRVLQD
jgi:hypothetical protein